MICLVLNIKHAVHTGTVRLKQQLRSGMSDASGAFRRSEQIAGLHDVNYTEYVYKGGPVEIPAPKHWNLIGRSMTIATCVIAQQYSAGSFFSIRVLSRTEKLDSPFRNGIPFPQKLSENCEKGLLASSCLYVYLFVRTKLDFHWTDFHEISYLSIFRKSVEEIQVSLKSDKNNGYFA